MTTPLKLNSRFIVPIAMLFVTASLAADAIAYKLIGIGPILEPGATIIFPLTYLIGDIVTEVYGYEMAKRLIWYGLAAEFIFAFLIKGVLMLPGASFWHFQRSYDIVLGSLPRFVFAGLIGDLASSFLNAYVVSKTKIFMKGKYFWIRSIVATAISEFALVILTAFVAFTGKLPGWEMIKLFISAYGLEIVYAFVFVWPGWMLVKALKRWERIDAFDYDVSYNPFKFC